jgi:hypothetical protein
MKRFHPLVALLLALALLGLPLLAATGEQRAEKKAATPGLEMAALATQITGIAISPLLGVSAVGAWQWFKADTPERKAELPWFAKPQFWLVGLLLVVAVAVKDAAGATLPPGWKKPLDIADTIENKISGLVAAGAVIPSLVLFASKFMMSEATGPAPVQLGGTGLAMLPVAAIDFSWLLAAAMVPLSIVLFGIVWLASHAINVLILLSPWGGVDAALKAARTSLLGLVTATAWIDPVVGATLSVVIILFAWLIAGWSFRLLVFGWIFCWDTFTFRRRRFQVLADANRMFLGRKLEGAPLRTYGRLCQEDDGRLVFRFKPWLVLPERTVELPRAGLVVGRGVFYSEVLGHDAGADRLRTLLLLPPRYLGHEELLARTYGISGTCEIGLRRAWTWLKESLGFRARRATAPA